VENYRPGALDKLGLGYADLAAINPRLIYASISGYGQTGPHRQKGGFDLVAQGVSGIMSVTGEPGGAPVKSGIPLTDLGAGMFATIGILAALQSRHHTGKGQHIDTSLLDAGVGLSVWESTQYFSGRGIPERLGSAHRMSAPYQAFRCADGYITLGGANDRSFHRICEVLGHPEWKQAPEFVTDGMRIRNRADLRRASRRSPRPSHARTGSSCSTQTTSRAGPSTITRRCLRTRRSSRASSSSMSSIRRSAQSGRSVHRSS
jgi:formyl-CoA transferase